MSLKKITFLASLSMGVCGATSIPLIGMNSKGKVVEKLVNEKDFSNWMKKSSAATAELIQENHHLQTENQAELSLKQVDLGLGFKASIGLGEVVKASAEPTITFKFKRK